MHGGSSRPYNATELYTLLQGVLIMKLEIKNNWEYLTYKFNGKDIDETKGGKVLLTTGETVEYKSIKGSKSYNDMGHTYSATQYKLIATIIFNGQEIDVELKKLDIDKFL